MFELGPELADKLKQLRVRVEIPDGDTVFLRNVPANNQFFNKARTNLLIKRPREGSPFLVCVDEDLQYTGNDSALVRAFSGAHRQQGWRVLLVDHDSEKAVDRVTESALKVLGFDGDEPALQPANDAARQPSEGLLGAFGTNLSERVEQGLAEKTVARVEQIRNVIACLWQREARIPVITGASGVGKTNLLYGVARQLRATEGDTTLVDSPIPRELISVDLGVMMAGTMFDSERENLLAALLKQAAQSPEIILALEHIELALTGVPRGQWLLAQAADSGVKLIGTALTLGNSLGSNSSTIARSQTIGSSPTTGNSLAEVRFAIAPLLRRVCIVELNEPWPEELAEILAEHRCLIAAHHSVTIDDSLLPLVIETSRRLEGQYPAKAIALLDAAASHARLSPERSVNSNDIHQSASSFRPAAKHREDELSL